MPTATEAENVALDANYFKLTFDGVTIPFKTISGIDIQAPIQTSEMPTNQGQPSRQRTRGVVSYAPLQCSMGATADLALDEWMQKVVDTGMTGNTKAGTLELYSAANEMVATWTLEEAIITNLSYSGMGMGSNGHLDVTAGFDCANITREQ
jgi:phage tail-like protein